MSVDLSAREALLDRVAVHVTANGVGNTSLRDLAAAVGTSHRMLLYHFGSRDGLLAAVVEATWGQRPQQLASLLADNDDLHAVAYAIWTDMADEAETLGPLFFEVAAGAMHGHQWAAALPGWINAWTRTLEELFIQDGHPSEHAARLSRMTLAVARGLLFELSLTGDRGQADAVIRELLEFALRRSPRGI